MDQNILIISGQIDMRPAQRVESQAVVPLVETYSSCRGITIFDSYVYVLYPNTIRVYEHFSHNFMPELSEELIVSQRKILRFAVDCHHIAVLFEDSKVQIRSRGHWERVQFSFNLAQEATKIGQFSLAHDILVYQYYDEQQKSDIYAFLTLNSTSRSDPQNSVLFWKSNIKFDQFTTLKELGNIQSFYFGLTANQIRFGTYFKQDSTPKLDQFQFGKIKQENIQNKVAFFSIMSLSNNSTGIKDEYLPVQAQNLYIIKLVDETPGKNRLVLKYRKFYEHTPAEKVEMDSEEKRIEAYTKMMNTLLQINPPKIQGKGENSFEVQPVESEGRPGCSFDGKRKLSKSIQIDLLKDQTFSNFVEKKDSLYFSTNQRVFKFTLVQRNDQIDGQISQVFSLEKGSRFIEACQNNIYLVVPNLCVASYGCQIQERPLPKKKAREQKEGVRSVHIQTEALSDVLLDQMEQKELSQMIDNLFEKKQVIDAEVQTEIQISQIFQFQQRNEEKEVEKSHEKQQAKSYSEISIGGTLPMCPSSHEEALRKIDHSLVEIQNSIHKDTIKKMQDMIKREQEKTKQEVEKKIQQFMGTAITSTIIPAIEGHIRQIFQAKLQEVNVYLYSLTMANLLHLKQEIEKDQVKENMLRVELIKKQLYEVAESKKAVSQMVEICKMKDIQKIVFFQEVKKKFVEIEKKVQFLQEKVIALIQGEQVNEAKLFDQIEIIKTMLKCQAEKNRSEEKVESEKIKSDNECSEEEGSQSSERTDSENGDSQRTSQIQVSDLQFNKKVAVSTRREVRLIGANQVPPPYYQQYMPVQIPYANYGHYPYQPPVPPPQYMPYLPQGYGIEMGIRPNRDMSGMVPFPNIGMLKKVNAGQKQEQKKRHKKAEK